MTPWNVLVSDVSLVNFMVRVHHMACSNLGYTHSRLLDCLQASFVNSRYVHPHGIYAYNKYGTNWRATISFLIDFVPLLPGSAYSVSVVIIAETLFEEVILINTG
jgi:NCS1 family nucleobase:cation symporter-1